MATALHGCTVCGSRFEVRFGFQIQRLDSGVLYFCSQRCHEDALYRDRRRLCSLCDCQFELRYAYQQVSTNGRVRFYCSKVCRDHEVPAAGRESPSKPRPSQTRGQTPVRIAVINQKGGTGKTTTSVSLAAGFAELGLQTLVVDLDAQGHVAASLGAKSQDGLYPFIVDHRAARFCLEELRPNLHALVADERLANLEIWLARMATQSDRVLRDRMATIEAHYDVVVLDCGPAMSLLNVNALTYADYVIVPVSCDYLSLVGVKQMLRTLERVKAQLRARVEILGVIPTFYDRRNRISDQAVKALRSYFREKVFPPIRVNTKLKEAPQHRQSIFEYAPKSRGAKDYRAVVERVADLTGLTDQIAPVHSAG